jgi:1-acyl-sn-glycerol-3-phosphate acyltransferase
MQYMSLGLICAQTAFKEGFEVKWSQMEAYEIIPSILQRLIWIPMRLLLTVFCSLEIEGIENIKKIKSNMIIASNHSSELDPLIIAASLPFFSRHFPLFFISREKEFYKNIGWKKIIYGGTFFKIWGAHQAYVGLKDYEQALRYHIKIIKSGKTVSIFPSGKRVLEGETVKARGGVSFLAKATKLPIMPILIQGAERISARDFFSAKRKIRVVFGKPIYAKDIFKNPESIVINDVQNDFEVASNVVMKKIAQLA